MLEEYSPHMNNIYKFQHICTDRQIECVNTFQLCWKMLKKDKNEAKRIYMRKENYNFFEQIIS